jgi:hypothetical protein
MERTYPIRQDFHIDLDKKWNLVTLGKSMRTVSKFVDAMRYLYIREVSHELIFYFQAWYSERDLEFKGWKGNPSQILLNLGSTDESTLENSRVKRRRMNGEIMAASSTFPFAPTDEENDAYLQTQLDNIHNKSCGNGDHDEKEENVT